MAHQKSFGLGQSKTVRSLHTSQALAQGVRTILLSSVTLATVLGVPSLLGFMNVPDAIAIAQTTIPSVSPSALPQGSNLTIEGAGRLAAANKNYSLDGGLAWLPWVLGLGLIGLAGWLLRNKVTDAASSPTEPIVGSTEAVPTTPDPVAPPTEAPADLDAVAVAAVAVGTAAALSIDEDPRSSESTRSASPVGDDSVVAVDHDVATYGVGTAQVNPRDSAGNSGGLKFPAIDSAINPQDIAITGISAAGLAGIACQQKVSDESAANADPAAPLVLAVTLPHEPITQLPPDIHAPLDSEAITMDPAEIVAGMGAVALTTNITTLTADQLADVDQDLPDLASGYGESRIVLMPRDPQWAYTYWDIPNEHRQLVRDLGGEQLALRLYDATDLDLSKNNSHSVQQYACDELARAWYLPIPVSDRDYIAEVGYLTGSGEWLLLARSNRIAIPPVYPSDWMDEQSITVDWEEPLEGKTFLQLVPPGTEQPEANEAFHEQIFNLAYGMDQESRVSGSLFGSMHQISAESLSSFVFPAGTGLWANEVMGLTASGVGRSAIGMSGIGMSGIGMSGIGMGAAVPPDRSRKFWLVADAELIVHGATEPDAQLTIGGVPVQLTPEGTFRIQLSFQDGRLDFPIMAIAKDGQQMRQIRMTFDRATPLRKTNTKEDGTDERY